MDVVCGHGLSISYRFPLDNCMTAFSQAVTISLRVLLYCYIEAVFFKPHCLRFHNNNVILYEYVNCNQ